MNFRIADSFTTALGRLPNEAQKQVKLTVFDLQTNPGHPALKFHKLNKARDPGFRSVRVSRDLRLIVHQSGSGLLLCHVDRHDAAYQWAERRRIERHPRTGAAQLVEIEEVSRRETVAPGASAPGAGVPDGELGPALFEDRSEDELLSWGVPSDWLARVRAVDEGGLFDLLERLPAEAAEALLSLAAGEEPVAAPATAADTDPFDHPDAQRRFRAFTGRDELERALDFPWEKWTVFLHPAQRRFATDGYGGPARVAGSAGTGKTVVAIHRAVHLARRAPEARVLLTTFNSALARHLGLKLDRLTGIDSAVGSRITVKPVRAVAHDLHSELIGQPNMTPASVQRALVREALKGLDGPGFTEAFAYAEWREVADAWQLADWEAYRDVPRLGRKTRLGQRQREALWSVMEHVRAGLAQRSMTTWSAMFARVTAALQEHRARPFAHAVIDEAQDVGVAELRFLAALTGGTPDGLFFAGDLGQRIFRQPFSWRRLGVDVRGRSHTLRINYRTSQQIRAAADRLLPASISDVDGNAEDRRGAVSLFDGPPPELAVLKCTDDETAHVAAWLEARRAEGVAPEEIGLFVRSEAELDRARAAAKEAGLRWLNISDEQALGDGLVSIGDMHRAKGLEFRAVAVMACDEDVIPSEARIAEIGDEADLQEVYDTERHLLYVAATRARDHLLITGVDPASEFMDDLG